MLQLEQAYEINSDQIDFFRQHGFIKLKQVLSPEVLALYEGSITAEVNRLNREYRPMEERNAYEAAFLQIMNIWRQNETVKDLVFSKRLAKIAADLLGVEGVRLYHDQALYKEAGGGHTPWHADQFYWPLEGDHTITAWIPLQETSLEMGALEFSAGSHRFTEGRELEISDASERLIDEMLNKTDCKHIIEPFELGEVSFHSGWMYHRAAGNQTDQIRKTMTIIYMEDGIKLKKPENVQQQNDWRTWMPGAVVGEIVDTPLNPVLYRN